MIVIKPRTRDAWLEWVQTRNWDIFAHLTFARARRATKERATGAWCTAMAILAEYCGLTGNRRRRRERLPWAMTIEPHREGGFHIHGLVAHPDPGVSLTPEALRRYWVGSNPIRPHIGTAKVVPVDPNRARSAAWYVVKGADLNAEVMVSKALKRT